MANENIFDEPKVDDTRDKQYPLFPRLSEAGAKEAQELINSFKKQLVKIADDAIGDLYVDLSANIESDHWTNYRNHLLAGLCNYGNRKAQADYDFAKIRRAIFESYRDEIIPDLNQDLLKEVEDLKAKLAAQVEMCDRYHRSRSL